MFPRPLPYVRPNQCIDTDKAAALVWVRLPAYLAYLNRVLPLPPPYASFNCPAVRDTDKAAALLWLLREGLPKGSPTLVFASTRHHVEFLTLLLSLEGVGVTAVHGSMDQVCL